MKEEKEGRKEKRKRGKKGGVMPPDLDPPLSRRRQIDVESSSGI